MSLMIFYVELLGWLVINFHLQVLNHLLYLMRVSEKAVQRRVALALAHLCSADDQRTIFIDNNGMPFFFSNIKYNQ